MRGSDDQPSAEPKVDERARGHRQLIKHVIEVSIGAVLALSFFLMLLGALTTMFPDSTPIASLARPGDGGAGGGRSEIDMSGVDGDTGIRIAKLSGMERTVRDKPAGSVIWDTARVGKSLGDRHAVQTSSESRATIEFDGKNQLDLAENSLIVVRRPNRLARSWRKRASVVFIDGELRGSLDAGADAENQVDIVAHGRRLRPTDASQPADFELRAEADGSTTLALHGGGMELTQGDEVIRIPANHAVTFDEHGVGRARALPPPPRLTRPDSGSGFVYRSIPPRVEMAWKARTPRQLHRVTIARDPSFKTVVHQQTLTDDQFVHGNLADGEYFWRVSAMRDEIAGAPSPARRFRVERDSSPPALAVELAAAAGQLDAIRVSGRTEPGATLLIGDNEVDLEHDGRFDQEYRVRPGLNFIVVQAIDPAGNAVFHSEEFGAGPLVSRSSP